MVYLSVYIIIAVVFPSIADKTHREKIEKHLLNLNCFLISRLRCLILYVISKVWQSVNVFGWRASTN